MAATRSLTRSIFTTFRQTLTPTFTPSLRLLLPLSAFSSPFRHVTVAASAQGFSTRPATTSLNDPNPNWSNRPPKETILLDGCDFQHWLVVVEKPQGDVTRDHIIHSYVKILAQIVGSEEEARMKIYSVSTRHYFAFGALVSEELSYKLKELPGVRWVLPDSYLDVKNKDYGGEPFINGQAVPYDPKYHEEWVRNNARANERNRRNDRPRNFDRSRNFERRTQGGPPMTGAPQGAGGPQGNMGPPQGNMAGGPQGGNMMRGPPGNMGHNMGGPPPGNVGPQNGPNFQGGPPMGGGAPPNMGGMPPRGGGMQPNNMGNPPNYNAGPPMGGGAPPNMGGMPPRTGGMPPNNMENPPNYNAGPNPGGYPNNQQNFNYGNGPASGSAPTPYQSGPNPNHNNFAPNNGNPYQNQDMAGRDY